MINTAFMLDAAFVTVLVLMGLGLNHWYSRRGKRKRDKMLKGGDGDDA